MTASDRRRRWTARHTDRSSRRRSHLATSRRSRRVGPAGGRRALPAAPTISVHGDASRGDRHADVPGRHRAGRRTPDRLVRAVGTTTVQVTLGGRLADARRARCRRQLVATVDVAAPRPSACTPCRCRLRAHRRPQRRSRYSPARRSPSRSPAPSATPTRIAVEAADRRLFGTDGIRGVANVDLRPPLAYALGRATAQRLAARRRAAARRPGHAPLRRHARGRHRRRRDVDGRRRPSRSASARRRRSRSSTAAGRLRRGHHGLGLAQPGRRQRPQGARRQRPEARRRGRGGARGADLARRRAARPDQRRARPRRRRRRGCSTTTSPHRTALARRIDASELRIVVDCANGSGGVVAPQILRRHGRQRRGHLRRARRQQHQPRLRRDGARGTRRAAWPRAAPTSASRSTATRTAAWPSTSAARSSMATSSSASWRSSASRRGALAEAARSSSASCPTAACERRRGAPAAGSCGRRSATSTSSMRCSSSGAGAGWREERPRHRPRAHHDAVTASSPRSRCCASWPRAGRPLSELAAQMPLYPQQQRAVHVRHKDQWEADRQLAAAVAGGRGGAGRAGRVLVRPSGTEPALRIMVEGEDAARVARAGRRAGCARRRALN